jgi:hypothetical protein
MGGQYPGATHDAKGKRTASRRLTCGSHRLGSTILACNPTRFWAILSPNVIMTLPPKSFSKTDLPRIPSLISSLRTGNLNNDHRCDHPPPVRP